MKHIIRYTSLILAAVLACFSFASCASTASSKEERQTVMTVGGYEVPYELYRYFVMNYRDTYVTDESVWDDSDGAEEMNKKISDAVIGSLRDFYAVFSLCGDYGVEVDGDYISSAADAAVESAKAEYDKTSEYKKSLEESYMNESVYRLCEKKNASSDELYYAMINAGDINTDSDYMRSLIESDSFICIKQILVLGSASTADKDGTTFTAAAQHTDSEAAAIAQEAQAKAAAGEDFDSLVADYGESLYMFGNTDGYYLCRGMWDDANENAAFALEVGEVSPVVQSDRGFSVFKRVEKSAAYIDTHFDDICEDYYGAVFMLALEKRSAELTVETNELYDSYVISEMK